MSDYFRKWLKAMQKIDAFDFRKRRTNNSRSIDNVDLFLNDSTVQYRIVRT